MTTNQPPTEQARELEKNILSIIEAHFKPSDNSLMPLNATKRVMQLITADRKRVELEARIHEIGLMQHQARVNLKTSNAVAGWGDIRIAELKAQQGEV